MLCYLILECDTHHFTAQNVAQVGELDCEHKAICPDQDLTASCALLCSHPPHILQGSRALCSVEFMR